jgi:hypothetical protein
MRGATVAVSDDEKDQLDAAARVLFGTDDVPHGTAVSTLCSKVLDGETNDEITE